jgi:hypothetical protein
MTSGKRRQFAYALARNQQIKVGKSAVALAIVLGDIQAKRRAVQALCEEIYFWEGDDDPSASRIPAKASKRRKP